MLIRTPLAALVLAFTVTGCTADAEPRPLPPAPIVSPTPAALEVPPEAMAETPEGASAFARYYFEAVNRAYLSQDPEQVRRLSAPACNSCRNIVEDIERLRTNALSVGGARYRMAFVETAPFATGQSVIVDFRFSSDPYVETAAPGSTGASHPAVADQDGQARLVWQDGHWLVLGLRLVPAS